jgi:hypothetical protein
MGGIAICILQVRAQECRPAARSVLTLGGFPRAKQLSSASSKSRHSPIRYKITRRLA